MFEKIVQLANKYRSINNFETAQTLTKIAVDLALIEEQTLLKQALSKSKQISSKLKQLYLYQHASQIDRLAEDLENKIGEFEVEDPIQAVLKSYSLIHKVAETQTNTINDIVTFVEVATEAGEMSDQQILQEIKKRTLGLSDQDKEHIFYILQKEFNLSPSNLSRQAQSTLTDKQQDKSQKQTLEVSDFSKDFSKKVDEVKQDTKKQEQEDKSGHEWYATFPTTPPVWGGFAYQAIVPYQQSSQINFWSLAQSEQEQLLNKLGFSAK